MAAWTTPVLEGEVVRLEPIAPEHEDGLWDASRYARTWQWLSVEQPQTREALRAYLDAALASAADGGERRDSAWYSVLDDEWPAVRANLLRRLGR